ncbi:MAG: CaiB/BaiF CoA transferase family protein [Gaiellales bacterium]
MSEGAPLEGYRVLDYSQYVAGPLATMLLADLGAEVVKVEPPAGDAWRSYEPFAPGESRYFYALNRNKRSLVLDLKTRDGVAASHRLIAGADAVVHNVPPDRARRFGLDRESIRAANPRAVWCCVSAFGLDGPEAGRPAYDLVAQAWSGLLMQAARPGDAVPVRAGGLAVADFAAGLLAAVAVVAGLADRGEAGRGMEVSLLGASLLMQAQRFVAVSRLDEPQPVAPEQAARIDELEPYYRAHRASDGVFALACLNVRMRRSVCDLLGLDDPFLENPQAPPADEAERARRLAHVRRVERAFRARGAAGWVSDLTSRGVPAIEVRTLDQLFDCPQAEANGLVQTVAQPGVGDVRLLGNVFKVDGRAVGARHPAPELGELGA